MIVTIDGPAGAGKSSVARRLAASLGFRFLDTGAMYRAVTWASLRRGINLSDPDALLDVARNLTILLDGDRVLIESNDVTNEIRAPEVTSNVHFAADHPQVRQRLIDLQREFAGTSNTVAEGRDQGTVAFPHAECKFFLTASPLERAKRRHAELVARGEAITLEETLAQQAERDERDARRPVGALLKAQDALEFLTDGMSEDEVVARLEEIVMERLKDLPQRRIDQGAGAALATPRRGSSVAAGS